MKKFSTGLKLLSCNFRDIVFFEIIYNLVTNAAVIPLLKIILNAAIEISGYGYISNRNLLSFLKTPSTIIIIIFILLLVAICTLFEISAIVYLFNNSIQNKKTNFAGMFYMGFDTCKRALKKGNFSVLLYAVFILPITKLSVMSNLISSIGIPDIISYYAQRKQAVLIIYICITLLISVCFVKWIFSINYFACENTNFRTAHRKSASLVKGNFFKTFFSLILWELSAVLFFVLIIFTFAFAVYMLARNNIIPENAVNLISDFSRLMISGFSFLAVPIIFAFICTDCFIRRNISCQIFSSIIKYDLKKPSKLSVRIASAVTCLALVLNVIYSYNTFKNGYGINMEIFNNVQISAHRGDSKSAPENTLPAFELAIENNADWIELDVQEAMDGTVIVMHDSNFKRTTGVNKNVWELSYMEIRQLDAGKLFSKKYEGTKIPLFEEVLNLTKGKIKLNIEIKPSGHEQNLEKSVAELISKYNIEDECIVSSFSANSLKKIKAENENIRTGYIMSMAMGNIENIHYADVFSINSVFISNVLVDSVHASGKEIYAWTVNRKSEIIKMSEYDVDNIITDNPLFARNVLESAESDNIFLRLLVYLFGDL